jgi:hypothetical protein
LLEKRAGAATIFPSGETVKIPTLPVVIEFGIAKKISSPEVAIFFIITGLKEIRGFISLVSARTLELMMKMKERVRNFVLSWKKVLMYPIPHLVNFNGAIGRTL